MGHDDSSIMQLSGDGNRLIAPHSNTSMIIIHEYNKTKHDWNIIGIINETSMALSNATAIEVSSISSSYDGYAIAFSSNYYHNYDDNTTINNNEIAKSFIGIYEWNDASANIALDNI